MTAYYSDYYTDALRAQVTRQYGTIVVLVIAFAIVVGCVAKGKGRSFFGFFIGSLFLSPLIMGIIVACVSNKSGDSGFNPPLDNRNLSTIDHIFYCKDCGRTYSGMFNDGRRCANCRGELVETDITTEKWRGLSEAEKGVYRVEMQSGKYDLGRDGGSADGGT